MLRPRDATGTGGDGDDRQVGADKRRHPAVAPPRRSPGGVARSHGRSVLGEQGPGSWTIPEGRGGRGRGAGWSLAEFAEETGHELPATLLIELGEIRQKSGKLVLAWAAQGDLAAPTAVSNTYRMEWPPRSGRVETFFEIDRVEWFALEQARRKLKAAQVPFLDRLQTAIAADR